MTSALIVDFANIEEVISAGATVYTTLGGSHVETDSIGNDRPVRDAGTLRNMGYLVGSTNTTTSSSTVRPDISQAGTSNITITVATTDSDTYLENTGSEDDVLATDELAWRITNGGGGNLGQRMFAIEFDADTDAVSLVGINSPGSTNFNGNSTSVYAAIFGQRHTQTTESDAFTEMQGAVTWGDLGYITGVVSRTSDSFCRSRIDSLDGNQTVTITGADDSTLLENTGTDDDVLDGEEINWEIENGTGSGEANNIEKICSSLKSTSGRSYNGSHGNDERINDGVSAYFAMRSVMFESSTETLKQTTMRFAATWKLFTAKVTEQVGPVTVTVRPRIDSGAGLVNGNQSVVITTVTTATDTGSEDDLVAGDEVSTQATSPVGGTRYALQYILNVLEVSAAAASRPPLSPIRQHAPVRASFY